MEKSIIKLFRKLKTIVVTGPESTGKTMISEYLSGKLKCPWIPEYARDYIGRLAQPYLYEDLVHIAKTQIVQKDQAALSNAEFLVLDTWLIITKVWFMEAFNKSPDWMDEQIKNHRIDLYIICKPDIPWIPDPLRENGGEKRDYLLNRYVEEIAKSGSNFVFVTGVNEMRYLNALNAVLENFKLKL